MKFELEFFEEFIKNECRHSKRKNPKPEVADFPSKCKSIEDEVQRIKKVFRDRLFQMTDEKLLEHYIQRHQDFIIKLANRVASALDKNHQLTDEISPGHTRSNLCKVLLNALEELLTFIERHCSKYFDLDQRISDAYSFLSVKEFEEDYKNLKELLTSKKVDGEMIRIILFPLHQFITDKEKQSITFRRLIFLKYLVKDIQRLIKNFPKESLSNALYEHMFYLNFNGHYFVNYTIDRIRTELQNLTTVRDQLDLLSHTLKSLNQIQVKPSFGLKHNRDSLRDQLLKWLKEEIYYIEKKHQLSLMIPPASQAQEPEATYKIKTSLSVPQLAYSIKLLKESGVIMNENKTELIRFFSKHFSSVNNKNISTESFRGKYFTNERSTIVSVRDLLKELIDRSKTDG